VAIIRWLEDPDPLLLCRWSDVSFLATFLFLSYCANTLITSLFFFCILCNHWEAHHSPSCFSDFVSVKETRLPLSVIRPLSLSPIFVAHPFRSSLCRLSQFIPRVASTQFMADKSSLLFPEGEFQSTTQLIVNPQKFQPPCFGFPSPFVLLFGRPVREFLPFTKFRTCHAIVSLPLVVAIRFSPSSGRILGSARFVALSSLWSCPHSSGLSSLRWPFQGVAPLFRFFVLFRNPQPKKGELVPMSFPFAGKIGAFYKTLHDPSLALFSMMGP